MGVPDYYCRPRDTRWVAHLPEVSVPEEEYGPVITSAPHHEFVLPAAVWSSKREWLECSLICTRPTLATYKSGDICYDVLVIMHRHNMSKDDILEVLQTDIKQEKGDKGDDDEKKQEGRGTRGKRSNLKWPPIVCGGADAVAWHDSHPSILAVRGTKLSVPPM